MRTAKHYSQRHERIRGEWKSVRATALSWMKEGLTPVSVTTVNTRTNALETFFIGKDLERALNLNEEEIGGARSQRIHDAVY